MSAAAPRRFDFGPVFDGAGGVAVPVQRPKRAYTPDEVEAIRREARDAGERAALASLQSRQTAALEQIAAACAEALPRLAQVAHEHRGASAGLALACARAIADAALDRFPEAPLRAALDALAREVEAAPRLVVSASPDLADAVHGLLEEAAQRIGFSGAVQVRAEADLPAHAFVLDFGDGQASFDPAAAAGRVTEALEAALAAEGLHAEPLVPGTES